MPKADLHTHSTVSDGRLSPSALVERAAAQGVTLMALTDHDNVGGLAEAQAACKRLGLELVAGVEISADYEPGTMHILGLGIDPTEERLLLRLDFLQAARRERNPKVVQKLRALGLDVTLAEVEALAGSRQLGRPHFAQALLNRKAVSNFEEAFERYLGKGKPAYVPKTRLSPRESIELIHQAGGVAVLAHPVQLRLQGRELEALVESLAALGLDGLEAIHSDHDESLSRAYQDLAGRLGLKISGGSDFHGIPGRAAELGRPSFDVEQAHELLRGRA
jgi:predicted metal-dependent phosphoesterase TrpH